MMTRPAAFERKKADELDRRIADTLRDSAGAEAPAAAQDVERLAALAALLRSDLRAAQPDEAARRRAQARLLQRMRAPQPPSRRVPRLGFLKPAFAIAGLTLVILFFSVTGVAYASAASLPGDALYSVKRGMEQVQLAVSVTDEGDARLVGAFADRRLAEIEALSRLGRWSELERALQSYPSVVDDLVALHAKGASADGGAQLRRHLGVLERVRQQVPLSAQSALDKALDRANRGQDEVEKGQDEGKPGQGPPGQERKDGSSRPGSGSGPDSPGKPVRDPKTTPPVPR